LSANKDYSKLTKNKLKINTLIKNKIKYLILGSI